MNMAEPIEAGTRSRFTPAQVYAARSAAQQAQRTIVAVLEEQSGLDPQHFVQRLATTLHYPTATMADLHRMAPAFDVLPFAEAMERECLALRDEEDALVLIMGDPFNIDLQAWAEERMVAGFSWRLAHRADVAAYLARHEETLHAMDGLLPSSDRDASAGSGTEDLSFKTISEDTSPVVKLVHSTVYDALKASVSDIHLECTPAGLSIRYRIDGVLTTVGSLAGLEMAEQVISRIKILCNMKIDETRIPQDGRFSTAVESQTIDFRVSTFPTSLGEKVVIRVLDPNAGLQTFEDLGLEGENLAKFKVALRKPYGLVLVTGPTGSGKTTTLYTGLKMLNSEEVNIVSLEDPVEYFIEGVSQSQVRPELGYDFAQGLRQILRQDPDIIMVGEVRDEETATLVIHAALTGHIVLSTLHTNNAIGVIPRLIDMGIEKYLLPAALNLMVAQRLVRRLCAECRQQTSVKKELNDMLLEELKKSPPSFQKRIAPKLKGGKLVAFKAVGCKKCGESGYSGRVALFEVLTMTENLENVILKEPSEAVINEEAKLQGMVTIFQDGILKSLDGVTTIEEVLHVTGLGDDEGRRTGK